MYVNKMSFKKNPTWVSKSGRTELLDPGVAIWPGEESILWKSLRLSSRFCSKGKFYLKESEKM